MQTLIDAACDAQEEFPLDELEAFAAQHKFDAALTAWLARCQERINTYYAVDAAGRKFLPPCIPQLTASAGPKYVRIVRTDPCSRSAHAFVERATGNIYKPAGWKGPEKNFPRGNIYDEAGSMKWMGPYGVGNAR